MEEFIQRLLDNNFSTVCAVQICSHYMFHGDYAGLKEFVDYADRRNGKGENHD